MLRFKNSSLRRVLAEAIAHQCGVALVKDDGVYFLSQEGEFPPEGDQRYLAYADGCHPDDEGWQERARQEFGSNDFAAFFTLDNDVFEDILNSEDDLLVGGPSGNLAFATVAPDSAAN